jgi:hypothetical protein
MPERLDRVTILLKDGPVVISWDERTALLSRMGIHDPAGEGTKRKFSTVGATRPVELTSDEKVWLFEYIEACARPEHELGIELTDGIVALRDALEDDLRDPEQRAGHS